MKLFTQKTLSMTILGAALLTSCGQAPQMPIQSLQPQMNQATNQNIHRMNVQTQDSRQLLVRFRTEMDRSQTALFNAKYGLYVRNYIPELDAYIVDIDVTVGLKSTQIVGYLLNDPMVAFAEVNHSLQVAPIF